MEHMFTLLLFLYLYLLKKSNDVWFLSRLKATNFFFPLGYLDFPPFSNLCSVFALGWYRDMVHLLSIIYLLIYYHTHKIYHFFSHWVETQ